VADKFNFDRVLSNFNKLKTTLPVVIANEAQNFFAKSFQQGGFTDKSFKAWEPRAKETKKTVGKAILVKTGKLRRAVQNSIREKTFSKIRLMIDGATIPYASVHNNGERAGRGAGFQMPQRKFIGDSAELRKNQRATIIKQIDKVWK
jgi:phage gpG-like protein